MKIWLVLLAFLNGSYMFIDGLHVYLKGKYIGPDKPGPWSELFYKLNIDVFKIGWIFILYGILWLIWIYSYVTQKDWSFNMGLGISILTLWYLPIGTIISLVILAILLFARKKIGI